MNNYTNMNYQMPTEIPYEYNQIKAPNYNEKNMFSKNHTMYNPYIKNTYEEKTQNKHLKNKLAKQAGDNMKFNECDYIQQANPNNLYDVYNGFIRGNMFPDLYNQYKLNKPFDIKPLNEQAELLTMLDAYSFAAHDINLYLDVNPDDKNMLELFNQYCNQIKQIKNEYEKKYGPLTVENSNNYPWSWNETPWPWEK